MRISRKNFDHGPPLNLNPLLPLNVNQRSTEIQLISDSCDVFAQQVRYKHLCYCVKIHRGVTAPLTTTFLRLWRSHLSVPAISTDKAPLAPTFRHLWRSHLSVPAIRTDKECRKLVDYETVYVFGIFYWFFLLIEQNKQDRTIKIKKQIVLWCCL